ncbi:hypothetical protein KLP28_11675 [Nocardioidaceae bacterium]|nr:hypothetical protein KLP28_11675 [Nocardioidaceae bacterium]
MSVHPERSHPGAADLDAALASVCSAPRDVGTVDLLLRRPDVGARERLAVARFSTAEGVVGDTWSQRPSKRTADRSPHPLMQVNVMCSRVAAAVSGSEDPEQWLPAGDQVYVDLDLSVVNLPVGTRLELGTAVLEVTDEPHTGCLKFKDRFGKPALFWVSDADLLPLRLRGINARVVGEGEVAEGDQVRVRRPGAAG